MFTDRKAEFLGAERVTWYEIEDFASCYRFFRMRVHGISPKMPWFAYQDDLLSEISVLILPPVCHIFFAWISLICS